MQHSHSQSIAYASARIDGQLDCQFVKVGTLQTPLQSTPAAFFHVNGGLQRYPIWALDRLAAVVYCYSRAAREFGSPGNEQHIEVNLSANLVSGEKTVCVVAWSICWHTSRKVRSQAEAMIAELTGGSNWSKSWPFREAIQIPVKPEGVQR